VDPGESYIYKVVTISASEDAEPVPCEMPFVARMPVAVPSLISFTLLAGGLTSARVAITRPDPQTGQDLTREFSFDPGMSVHGKGWVPRAYTVDGIEKRWREEIDFSTNCVMVDTLSLLRSIDYRIRYDFRKERFVFSIRRSSNPLMIYLTPRRALRWKERGESGRETGATISRPRREVGRPRREPGRPMRLEDIPEPPPP